MLRGPTGPLLLYTTGALTITEDIQYSGAAIFLVAPSSSSGVSISNNVTTACVPIGSDACGRKFLSDPQSPATTDVLAVLTTGAAGNGNSSFDGHNGDTIMGVFYSGVPPSFVSGGLTSISHQITVLGAVAASALSMSQVPNFYQVPGGNVAELGFGSTSPWKILMVPGFWKICQPGATQTSPSTPTGICGYN